MLVQLRGPLNPADRAVLRETYGLALTAYVPHFAFLELVTAMTRCALSNATPVRAIVPYGREFKVADRIGGRTYRSTDRRAVEGLWLEVTLFSDSDPAHVLRVLAAPVAADVKILDARHLGGALQIRAKCQDRTTIARLATLKDVRWIDEVGEWVEDNGEAVGTIQSGDPTRPSVWNDGLHGEGQIISVMDTSPIDRNHCFFRESGANTPGPQHRKVIAIRNATVTSGGETVEVMPASHATFVAGCAAGDEIGNSGGHPNRGGAWAARVVSNNIVILKDEPLLSELSAAADAGAYVHTNSWHVNTSGTGQPASYDQSAADVDTFMWLHEDHVVLGSAGNTGEEQGPPGTAKNAICVGATQADPYELVFGDGNGGPTADGRSKPDVMVPGCGIESAKANTRCKLKAGVCASSWATPHAAAACALTRQYFVEGRYQGGGTKPGLGMTPTGALMKAMMVNSTVTMGSGGSPPTEREGWGAVRLNQVLLGGAMRDRIQVWDVRHASGLATGDSRDHWIIVPDGAQVLTVTLAWSDPPGTVGTKPALVNELVVSVHCGSRVRAAASADPAQREGSASGSAMLDNVQKLRIQGPAPGAWCLRVVATMVNVGRPRQGYALVATYL